MANIYVRSTDGSDADSGATWALAKATLTGAAAIDVAGDTIYVSQAHAETTAAAISFSWAGSLASPIRIICGNDAAEPPTAVSSAGTVTTTGNSDLSIMNTGGSTYVYGLTFIAGSGASGVARIFINRVANGRQFLENCSFQVATTNSGSVVFLGNGNGTIRLRSCTFKFANAGQGVDFGQATTISRIFGGSLLAGGTSPTNFFTLGQSATCYVDGFDFSNAAAAMNVANSNVVDATFIMRDCKLPGSWSGSLNASTPGRNSVWEMHNCDSTDTNYRYWRKTYLGDITHETIIIKTGGASDGTTGLSWKIVSNADPEFPYQTLESSEIVRWNETTGSAITITVDFVHDSLTKLTDREIWIDVQYLGTSGFPLSTFISDAAADVLATATDQTVSSSTWTTTGLTNPNKQQINVTFTPQEKGFIHAKVHVAKASYTVYVDPVLQVS